VANRTVSVALKMLIGDYVGPAEKASKATEGIGSSAEKTAQKYKHGAQQIVTGAGAAAVAGAFALNKIESAAMDFDKAMSGVAAVSNASADELKALRQAALDAGADTVFSASQAAEAEGELAKAGVSTSDILGGALTGSLGLAAAGQLDLADSATIAAQAMNIWQLRGSDVTHIADVLAAGANKSAADVSDLGLAMQQGGLVAAQMGIGLEDTIGTLAAFADRALRGSDAGTSLKTMLQRLASPSGEASDMMKKLGINVFDSSGQFVGLAGVAGQLHDKLGKLTQEQRNMALSTIFGSDAVRAASVLMENGKAGIQDYTKAVNDQGAAGRMAATQLDNLSGDVEQLSGSLETAFIKSGSTATGILRLLTQQATGAVNAFANLPGPVQAAALGLLATGTAGTGALATIGTLIPRIREARTALADMGKAGTIANRGIGLAGKAAGISIPILAAATIAWEIWSTRQAEAKKRAEDMAEAIKADNGFLAEHSRLTTIDALEQDGALKAADQLGISLATLTDAALLGAQAQGVVAGAIRDAANGTKEQREAALTLLTALGKQIKATKDGIDVNERKTAADITATDYTNKQTAAVDEAGRKTEAFTASAKDATGALQEYATAADALKAKIDALNETSLTAGEADIRYRDAIDAATKAIHDNGRSLDLNTAKGRDNVGTVIAAVRAAAAHAQAVANQTGSVQRGNVVFGQHIDQLRKTLLASGLTTTQVNKLIATYGRVPPKVLTDVKIKDQASGPLARIENTIRRIKAQDGTTVTVRVVDQTLVIGSGTAAKKGNAEGGWLSGGTPGVDSIPLANGELGMPGEFVVNRAAASRNGPLLEAINAGRLVTAAGRAGGTQVTVAAGAMPIYVQGNLDRSVMPDVQRVVHAEFRALAGQIATGRRG
jgi:TP901 family phage tail tape measure protein